MGYRLTNGLLEVKIEEPGTYYAQTRFDWTGFISQVTLLEGGHTFCVPESWEPGQGTGGAGLCNEFGITAPPGYETAAPGEQFPKLGIGLLTRADAGEYKFFVNYPLEPFAIEAVQEDEGTITFTTSSRETRGYAAELKKTLSLRENKLHLRYALTNIGTKPIETDEYVHNFLGIDNKPMGPDYRLQFPFEIVPVQPNRETMDEINLTGNSVSWPGRPTKDFYFMMEGFSAKGLPYLWDVCHLPSGTGVREISDYEVYRAAVWGQGHVVSPELFVKISVNPGKQQVWERVYEFYTDVAF